jgi:hypothetical protein
VIDAGGPWPIGRTGQRLSGNVCGGMPGATSHGTSWDVSVSAPCAYGVMLALWAIQTVVGVRSHEVHAGPSCQTVSDGSAVKGAASAVREAQAEGPTLTGATPMRPSWRVREGSLTWPTLTTHVGATQILDRIDPVVPEEHIG